MSPVTVRRSVPSLAATNRYSWAIPTKRSLRSTRIARSDSPSRTRRPPTGPGRLLRQALQARSSGSRRCRVGRIACVWGATLERRITLAHRPYGSGGPRSLGVGSRPSSSRASSRIVSCLRPDLHPGSALLLPIEIVGAFELRRRAPTRAGRGDGECSRPDHERDAGPPGERTQRVPSAEARGVRCSVEHARPGPGLRCPGPIVGVRTDGRGLGYNRG